MNRIISRVVIVFLLLGSVQLTSGQTEKQVIIKGKQTLKSNSVMNDIEKLIQDFFYTMEVEDMSEWQEIDEHDFTVTYTSDRMRMDVVNTRYKVNYFDNQQYNLELKEEVKARIVFYFSGSAFMMELFMEIDDGTMKRIAQAEAPKEGSFTMTDEMLGLFQGGGVPGTEWNGHPTLVYNYDNKTDVKEARKEDSVAKIVREDKTMLKVAQGVDGVEVMDAFYNRVVEGGYDLGGSDEGSLMSMIGWFLDEGMPVEIKEETEFFIRKGSGDGATSIRVGVSESDVSITSVETSEVAVELTASSSSESKLDNAAGKKDEDEPGGCDCSCEKYKELMALSNKKKKDIDTSTMQQIDMSCIQTCAMQWANCAKQ